MPKRPWDASSDPWVSWSTSSREEPHPERVDPQVGKISEQVWGSSRERGHHDHEHRVGGQNEPRNRPADRGSCLDTEDRQLATSADGDASQAIQTTTTAIRTFDTASTAFVMNTPSRLPATRSPLRHDGLATVRVWLPMIA